MFISVKGSFVERLKEGKILPPKDAREVKRQHRWVKVNDTKVRVDISPLSPEGLKKLEKYLSTLYDKAEGRGARSSIARTRNSVRDWISVKDNPEGQVAKQLRNIPSTMKELIATSEHRWVFGEGDDKSNVPWFVSNIEFHERTQYDDAKVDIKLLAASQLGSGSSSRRGDSSFRSLTVSIRGEGWKGKTMKQILKDKGFVLENSRLIKQYEEYREKYLDLMSQVGLQISASGLAISSSTWYRNDIVNLDRDQPAKMVVDDQGQLGATTTQCEIWETPEQEESLEEFWWDVPVQPYLKLFDLEDHEFYFVHVRNAEVYEYDDSVGDKLVLPLAVKDLLWVLVESAGEVFKDVISGKQGGSIVLCAGPPGTGKTLTAEVYSEIMHRPLYKVQSSQLGTTSQKLEEELKRILHRAQQWKAILLIDESDVYVHERGSDVEQNAIVGVFLRVLEYYSGVLFMTTNRETKIDDAILSRATAKIVYEMPSEEDQERLWRILADESQIKITDEIIKKIVHDHPSLSGRDIKNLLKLGGIIAKKKGTEVTPDLIDHLQQFGT